MKVSKLFLIMSIMAVLPSCSLAEDSTARNRDLSGDHRSGYVMPFGGNKDMNAMRADVERRNQQENMVRPKRDTEALAENLDKQLTGKINKPEEAGVELKKKRSDSIGQAEQNSDPVAEPGISPAASRDPVRVTNFIGNMDESQTSTYDNFDFKIMSAWMQDMPMLQTTGGVGNAASAGIKEVLYNSSGRVDGLTMNDGTVVMYEYRDEGELTIESVQDGVAITFVENSQESSQENEETGFTSTSSEPTAIDAPANVQGLDNAQDNPPNKESGRYKVSYQDNNGKRKYVVTVYLPAPSPSGASGVPDAWTAAQSNPALQGTRPNNTASVATLAKTPMMFDFKEIKKTIEKTSKVRASALKVYKHNMAGYYDEIASSIKNNIDALKKEGIDINEFEGHVSAAHRQDAVETALENIYVYARNGGADKTVKYIIQLESGLRNRIVSPEKEMYENRVKKAVECTDEMIEKLVNSQLALYLNVNKDKIDVIINLQKTPKTNK